MNNDLFNIIAYSVLWILVLFVYYKRRKNIGIAGYIILEYTVMSLTSIYFFFNTPGQREIFDVTFIPLIFLILCILLWIRPFVKYEDKLQEFKLVEFNHGGNVINFLLVCISPLILLAFYESVNIVAYTDVVSLGEAYSNKDVSISSSLSKMGRLGYTIVHYGAYIWPMLFFNGLSKGGKSSKLAYIALLAYIVEILLGYANGDRVTLVRFFLYLGITFMLMRNLLDENLFRKIKRVGLISFASVIVLLALITISRLSVLSDDYDMGGFLSLYTGEGSIRFSQYIWNLNRFSDGDTCFSLLKDLVGLDTFTTNAERRAYYEPIMNIPPYIFYTFIGDFYQDFGRFGTLIFSIIASLSIEKLLERSITRGYCNYLPFFLLTLVLQVVFFGFMYYNFKSYDDQIQLIAPFIFFAIIDFTNSKKGFY